MDAKERLVVVDALQALVCAKMPAKSADGYYVLNRVKVHESTYGPIHYIDPTSDGKIIDALVAALEVAKVTVATGAGPLTAMREIDAALALARGESGGE